MSAETDLFGRDRYDSEVLEEVTVGNEGFNISREIGLGRVATEGSSAESSQGKAAGEQKAEIVLEADPGWQHNAQPNFD